nr:unnamed protein product [Callosobruchus chinensis]
MPRKSGKKFNEVSKPSELPECCRPRSGLFRLLDNRFLPPPAKVKQTVDDLVLDEGGQFLDLPVNLALRLSTTLKDFLQMPYDYFCPTYFIVLTVVHAFICSSFIEYVSKCTTNTVIVSKNTKDNIFLQWGNIGNYSFL